MDNNAKVLLAGRDKKGRRVYITKMCKEAELMTFNSFWEKSFLAQAGSMNLIDLAQLDDLWFEAMLDEVETLENGIVILLDMSG